mmetsp:Transcript_14274/g.23959  ORF Transcript_14274/g.23959 Transcript_14274/m.23959 type:complete len:732 (+) Transcript_14274:275-2470(+)
MSLQDDRKRLRDVFSLPLFEAQNGGPRSCYPFIAKPPQVFEEKNAPPEPLIPTDPEMTKELAKHCSSIQKTSESMMRVVYDFDLLLAAHVRFGERGEHTEPYYKVQGEMDTTLVFESRFECGNLQKAYQLSESQYELLIRPDLSTTSNMQWFFFRVSNTRAKLRYKFIISNFYKSDSLFARGMRPLIFSEKEFKANKVGWRRFGSNVCYFQSSSQKVRVKGHEKSCGTLMFDFAFQHSYDTCYVAMNYPYSYSHLMQDLDALKKNIYTNNHFKRKMLCRTLAGNLCPYLVVEQEIDAPIRSTRTRPSLDIVVMARVHPGETNASWMMRGLLYFLTDERNEDATKLRSQCTIHVIPMLNPDGVINGNYRCSLANVDLNRKWENPKRHVQPTIYHAKELIRSLAAKKTLMCVIDLHGHSKKMNVFMYGCASPTLEERILPRLLWDKGLNFFQYSSCSFNIGKNKEGTARVALWKELDVLYSYTIEASFAGANFGRRQGQHFSPIDYAEMGAIIGRSILRFLSPEECKVVLAEVKEAAERESEDHGDEDDGSDSGSDADYGVASAKTGIATAMASSPPTNNTNNRRNQANARPQQQQQQRKDAIVRKQQMRRSPGRRRTLKITQPEMVFKGHAAARARRRNLINRELATAARHHHHHHQQHHQHHHQQHSPDDRSSGTTSNILYSSDTEDNNSNYNNNKSAYSSSIPVDDHGITGSMRRSSSSSRRKGGGGGGV